MLHFGLEGYGPIVIYSVGIVAFLLSISWRPDVGLFYLVLLLPLQTWRYNLHGLPLGAQFVDIMLLGIILGLLHQEGKIFTRTPLNNLLLIFAVFHYISLWHGAFNLGIDLPLWFDDARVSEWKNYMVMPLLCLVTVTAIKDVKQMQILIIVMCVSTLLVNRSVYTLLSARDLSHFDNSLREAGPLGYAGENGLAAFEAEFLLLLLGLYIFETRTVVKLGLLAVVATSLYCLLFAFSRGGYLGFLAGLLFLGVYKERKLLLVVAAVLIGWQVFLPTSVQERITMTYNDSGALESSAADRVSLWEDAIELFHEDPVLGTGFDTYEYMHRVGPYTDTHNYYLKVLVETGIIGLSLFLWFLGRGIALGYGLFRSADDQFLKGLGLGLASLIVGAVVINFFGDRWVRPQVTGFLWTLLGCAVRGQLIVEQEEAVTTQGASPVPAESSSTCELGDAVAISA